MKVVAILSICYFLTSDAILLANIFGPTATMTQKKIGVQTNIF